MPDTLTNATVTWRCSASPLATARWSRRARGTYAGRSRPPTASGGGIGLAPCGERSSRWPSSRAPASHAGSTLAAVSALTTISPASARSSSSNTRDAARPATSSSRCGTSVRKTCTSPEWTPHDMRSSTAPTDVCRPAIDSIAHCMSDAAPHARSGWRSPTKSSSSASPRNLSTSPPCRSATWIRPSKTDEIVSTSSSAPSRPARRAAPTSAVKPEMSTETSEPSSTRRRDGVSLLAPGAHQARDVRDEVGVAGSARGVFSHGPTSTRIDCAGCAPAERLYPPLRESEEQGGWGWVCGARS